MKLTLIRGIPGSGKSTTARKLAALSDVICEADDFYMVYGKYEFDIKQIGDAHKWCQAKVSYWLKRGHNVFVSNTSIHQKDIHVYNDIADRYNVEFFCHSCSGYYKNIHNVPEDVLKRMNNSYKIITNEMWKSIRKSKMEVK